MAGGVQPRSGPAIVEPVGYAVTQFVASIALVAGIGMAPDGLLLAAAAIIASVLDLRRFSALNPGVIPADREGFESPRGRVLMRFSRQSALVFIVLGALAVYFVQHDDANVGAIGPALVAGVVTLYLNWRIKTALTRVALQEIVAAKERDEALAAEWREIDERDDSA